MNCALAKGAGTLRHTIDCRATNNSILLTCFCPFQPLIATPIWLVCFKLLASSFTRLVFNASFFLLSLNVSTAELTSTSTSMPIIWQIPIRYRLFLPPQNIWQSSVGKKINKRVFKTFVISEENNTLSAIKIQVWFVEPMFPNMHSFRCYFGNFRFMPKRCYSTQANLSIHWFIHSVTVWYCGGMQLFLLLLLLLKYS